MADQPLDLDEALARVLARAEPLPAETVPLRKALGMTLYEDVVSELAIHPFDNSAMDGFAVRAADTARAPATLHLVGESRAGRPARDSSTIVSATGDSGVASATSAARTAKPSIAELSKG